MATSNHKSVPTDRAERERLWRKQVRRWQASGLNQADFCRLHRLSIPAFRWWKQEVARRDARPRKDLSRPAAAAHFLPVKIVQAPDSEPNRGLVELELQGGRVLRVRRGFDPDLLVKLMSVLESAS
jgi:hypothetical protein